MWKAQYLLHESRYYRHVIYNFRFSNNSIQKVYIVITLSIRFFLTWNKTKCSKRERNQKLGINKCLSYTEQQHLSQLSEKKNTVSGYLRFKHKYTQSCKWLLHTERSKGLCRNHRVCKWLQRSIFVLSSFCY